MNKKKQEFDKIYYANGQVYIENNNDIIKINAELAELKKKIEYYGKPYLSRLFNM